jgi:hypothetical protein
LGDGELRRSSGRILTTHVGSLPGLASFDASKADYREKVAAWAKLKSLTQGAALASQTLFRP